MMARDNLGAATGLRQQAIARSARNRLNSPFRLWTRPSQCAMGESELTRLRLYKFGLPRGIISQTVIDSKNEDFVALANCPAPASNQMQKRHAIRPARDSERQRPCEQFIKDGFNLVGT